MSSASNNLGCPSPNTKGSLVVGLTPSIIAAHNVLGFSGSTILLRANCKAIAIRNLIGIPLLALGSFCP
ncbi:hypothetical protein BC826DRAFT_90812 [Russula brevipes]|nr:hypothetical protein BC826DRAFT_90812 [Russula brevipes]